MRIFLDNFHQGGKYSTRITSHQVELRREGNFTNQKSLSISYLQIDYLNIDKISGCGKNSEREKLFQTRCTFVEVPIIMQKNVSKGSEMRNKKIVWLVI